VRGLGCDIYFLTVGRLANACILAFWQAKEPVGDISSHIGEVHRLSLGGGRQGAGEIYLIILKKAVTSIFRFITSQQYPIAVVNF